MRGPTKTTLVKLALQYIQRNEKKTFSPANTRLENEIWAVMKLVEDNRKKGGIWEKKGVEEGCRLATEILKFLHSEFREKRERVKINGSEIEKWMRGAAEERGISLEGGHGNVDARVYEEDDGSRIASPELADDVSYDEEHDDEYGPEIGANLFMLGLIVGLVLLVLILLFRGRGGSECVIEKTQWVVKR